MAISLSVTLPAYGFYWFLLAEEAEAPRWHQPAQDILPEFVTLTTRDGRVSTALSGRELRQLETDVLPKFLPLQRWFAAKDRALRDTRLTLLAQFDDGCHALTAVDVEVEGETHRYLLPVAALWGEENLGFGAPKLSYTIAKLRQGSRVGALIDGAFDQELADTLLTSIRQGRTIEWAAGSVQFLATPALQSMDEVGDRVRSPSNRAIYRSSTVIGHPEDLPAPSRRSSARCRNRQVFDR